jgi:hypothetical protein
MRIPFAAAIGAAVLALASCSSGSSGNPTVTATTTGTPLVDTANFTATVTNPWFPLHPGDKWIYAGTEDGERTRDVVAVTGRTRTIAGVQCVVVSDDVYTNGKLSETTHDYYAQDRKGNVWYFGEDTAELDDHGRVKSREGTWLTGRDGARPGIVMQAHPKVGMSYSQEHYAGHAEDHARVISTQGRVDTPGVTSSKVLVTLEWTPLEPKVREHKYYVRGYGQVKEQVFKGGQETSSLVSYTHGS